MQFLLTAINAKYIHSNPAVYSLKGYLPDELKSYVQIAEYTINHSVENIFSDIYDRQPDVIAISCYIWNWEVVEKLLGLLEKIMPQVPIWLGGPQASYGCKEILDKFPHITGIMVGEGEETFQEILLYYLKQGKSSLKEIKGIQIAEGFSGERGLTDVSALPFLYQDLDPFSNRILYYETQRGCPFRCSYCLSSIDKTVRFRDMNTVKRELQYFLDQNVVQVKFVDRTFNCNHKHAAEIWRYLVEHDNGVTNFHFEVSADLINEEELNIMSGMRPGLIQLEIGVQTTNPKTMEAIRRTSDLNRLKKVVEEIHSYQNIHQHLDLIAGLPFEDYESFGHSFNDVYRMHPNQLQLGFLKVLKGSYMYECIEEYGIKYMDFPPFEVLSTRWLSYKDVRRLKRIEEMVELYYNSNQYTHTLPALLRCFESPFALFGALADFYQEKGFLMNTPARAYRYEVLLQFAIYVDRDREEYYRELLTFDMYLRENVKSRPSFSKDPSLFKEETKAFYNAQDEALRKKGKQTHLEGFYYPVWLSPKELEEDVEREEELQFVFFDYEERNPLTHEAKTRYVGRIPLDAK